MGALIFGAAIVGAALVISWVAEAAQKDISQALALAFVALIAVLPEYAIDMVLAWKAGADPGGPYIHYAAANMTGANRLLVGIGWPMVFFLYWIKNRGHLELPRSISLELVPFGLAALFSFLIFFQGGIELWHAAVLLSIFGTYIWLSSRAGVEEPELAGPAHAIGSLSSSRRHLALLLLFLFSAVAIIASAEPFVEALLEAGEALAIDKFILIQWVAPLASEAPEILVALIFVLRGHALWAMVTLVSAKVNQWTLLVASLPITYSISLGEASALSLDPRQAEEFLLTSAQSLFAVILLTRLRIRAASAAVLFLLFITQLFIIDQTIRYVYSFIYLGLALFLLLKDRVRVRQIGVLVQDFLGRFKSGYVPE